MEAAVTLRGGPVQGTRRSVDARVALGYPGRWEWQMVVCARDFFRWQIPAAGAVQAWEEDNGQSRRFLGTAELPSLGTGADEVGPAARFLRTVDLDALLREPDVELVRTPPPAGAVAGLRVRWPGEPDGWQLGFDRRGLVVQAEGPFDAPFTGPVRLRMERSSFARHAGQLLPGRETYRIGTTLLADTKVTRWSVYALGDQSGPCASVSLGPSSSRSSR